MVSLTGRMYIVLEIYLVRHGETKLNKESVYYGWTDCDMTELGYTQAERLRTMLEENQFDVVYSSPLKRALHTAQIISKLDEEDIITDNRLKEINFGLWEKKHYKQIEVEYNQIWNKWCNDWKNTEPPEGESFIRLYKRTVDFINDMLINNINKKLLVVSHHGCLRIILSYLIHGSENGYWNYKFEHGCYTKIEVDEYKHTTLLKLNASKL